MNYDVTCEVPQIARITSITKFKQNLNVYSMLCENQLKPNELEYLYERLISNGDAD